MMKKLATICLVVAVVVGTSQATVIDLGTAANFAVLGGSGVTNASVSTFITGDVGSSPTTAVTGLTPLMVDGILYLTADPATALAHTDLIGAYTAAANALGGVAGPTDLGGATLTAGVYTYDTIALWTAGTLTLDGQSNPSSQWIFQIGSSLAVPASAAVSLINGASANNVFWQIGSSLTLAANNDFAGNILANTSITLGGGILDGRALAINGSVSISAAENIGAPVPEPATIDSTWVAVEYGQWGQASSWSPAMVPNNNPTNNFNVTINADDVDVTLEQTRTINSLDCFGEVYLRGTAHPILFFEGGGLTNHGELDITDIWISGDVNNLSGAFLELDNAEIFDDLYNQNNATIEVWGAVEADSIENLGTILITSGADLYIEDGNFVNLNQININGGKCGSEGDTSNFNNNTGASITGWGILYAEGSFNNSGSIKAQAGVLRISCQYTSLTNNGSLSADPSSSLQIKPAGDVNNLATINTIAGDFIVDANLINSSGATIQILDGIIAAKKITQKSGAVFNVYGKIAAENGFYIEAGATATITGPTSIIGNVTIESGATLQIKDGQTLITGQTVNNGTIELIGGTVIFQGGYSGGGTIPVTAGTDRNHFDVNSDGIEDLKDLASFTENWLWQASWY